MLNIPPCFFVETQQGIKKVLSCLAGCLCVIDEQIILAFISDFNLVVRDHIESRS